jgi:hypothetical protein
MMLVAAMLGLATAATITTVAGNGGPPSSDDGDGCPATLASLALPRHHPAAGLPAGEEK